MVGLRVSVTEWKMIPSWVFFDCIDFKLIQLFTSCITWAKFSDSFRSCEWSKSFGPIWWFWFRISWRVKLMGSLFFALGFSILSLELNVFFENLDSLLPWSMKMGVPPCWALWIESVTLAMWIDSFAFFCCFPFWDETSSLLFVFSWILSNSLLFEEEPTLMERVDSLFVPGWAFSLLSFVSGFTWDSLGQYSFFFSLFLSTSAPRQARFVKFSLFSYFSFPSFLDPLSIWLK